MLLMLVVSEVRHVVDYNIEEPRDTRCPLYTFNDKTVKFYRRRHLYFPECVASMTVDAASWPLLIPDCVVLHVAKKTGSSRRRESIIDGACGVG